jgi:hypothetical protein
MERMILAGAALAAALSTAGCVDTTEAVRGNTLAVAAVPTAPAPAPAAAAAPPEAPNTSAATWRMPWQVSPVSAASQAQGEQTIVSWVPETGYVRGTPRALASLGTPLRAVPGPNRTVDACRGVVESEAMKIGARTVEAASAGPHRRNAQGHYAAPVRMRITYAMPGGFEVREATMTCIVDARGNIVDARA